MKARHPLFILLVIATTLTHLFLLAQVKFAIIDAELPLLTAINFDGVIYSATLWAFIVFVLSFVRHRSPAIDNTSQEQKQTAPTKKSVVAPPVKRSSTSLKIESSFNARLEEKLNIIGNDVTIKKWSGWREFKVTRKEIENKDKSICSFYLEPYDKQAIPAFIPGQYLSFYLTGVDEGKSITRAYSLSDCNQENTYRISVKRQKAPRDNPDAKPGLSSNYFHDHVALGSTIQVKAPAGQFHIREDNQKGFVLLAGGVGLTPMVSILKHLVKEKSKRVIYFFYSVSHSDEYALLEEIKSGIASLENAKLFLCISREEGETGAIAKKLGVQESIIVRRRLDIELLKEALESSNFEFYICGSELFTHALANTLETWNVPKTDIKYEFLEPPKRKQVKSEKYKIKLNESNETLDWTGSGEESCILILARENEINLPYMCERGECGECRTTIIDGEVTYPNIQPTVDDPLLENECLLCIGAPKTDLILKA